MANYYFISINPLTSIFSHVVSGNEFELKLNSESVKFSDIGVTISDVILASKDDKIYYSLLVTNIKDSTLVLKKTFEIEKSINYIIEPIGDFHKLDIAKYNSICAKLFDSYSSTDIELLQSETNIQLDVLHDFAGWFIEHEGPKQNYFTKKFKTDKDTLLKQLEQYQQVYRQTFKNDVFKFSLNNISEHIETLDKNLYLDNGDFFKSNLL